MRLICICGGRYYKDRRAVEAALSSMLLPGDVIVQGGAFGADSIAKSVAEDLGFDVITAHANWNKYGRSAGLRRNAVMANLKPDLLIAFPGGPGTKAMTWLAEKKGIPIVRCGMADKQSPQGLTAKGAPPG